jgi:hypothetical protein
MEEKGEELRRIEENRGEGRGIEEREGMEY